MKAFTIGVDYGTNSVRAVVIDCADGREVGAHVFNYPSGHQGILLDPSDHNLARQNPADYVQGLEETVVGALTAAEASGEFKRDAVIGIGVDTTGSTPIPVNGDCVPLGMTEAFKDNLNAQAWLWKDHTAADEANTITKLGFEHRPHFLAKCGETYSSEWFWSKIWHCLNVDKPVFDAAHSWLECADYVPAVLAGITNPAEVVRGVCAAGHKALYCDEWGGLPDKEFLTMLDPALADLRDRLFEKAYDGATPAGGLCTAWASKLGLSEGIPITVGAIDAHLGAVGAGVQPGVLVKIMGTSTCDCTVAPNSETLKDIPGICGIVDGSILPGHFGLEAGQSAVGDIFKWFVETVCQGDDALHMALTNEAARQKPGQSGLLALDWNNGNRCLLVDPKLTGLLLGQTLYTTQAEIYRALIEATAFGARAIIERYKEYGVPVDRIICCGGIAEKNPMLMQIYADVTGCKMQVSASDQTCALGSALSAAVIAGPEKGGYGSFVEAQQHMTGVKDVEYTPDGVHQAAYDELYTLYMNVHDAFGGVTDAADLSGVMKALISLKDRQNS